MLCGYHLFTGGGIEGWRSGLKKDLCASRTGFFVLSSVFKEQVPDSTATASGRLCRSRITPYMST